MKKLILLFVFLCNFANAEQWFEMPNKAGGKIILLTEKCAGTNGGKMVIATTTDGTNVNGCWYYFAEMVHIVWKGGETSSFNPTDFSMKENK